MTLVQFISPRADAWWIARRIVKSNITKASSSAWRRRHKRRLQTLGFLQSIIRWWWWNSAKRLTVYGRTIWGRERRVRATTRIGLINVCWRKYFEEMSFNGKFSAKTGNKWSSELHKFSVAILRMDTKNFSLIRMLFESTWRKSGLEKSRNDAHFSCSGISWRDSFCGLFATSHGSFGISLMAAL